MALLRVIRSLILFVVFFNSSFVAAGGERTPRKIAIVGGGISGASTAFFLRELFGGEVLIDIYEKNEVGGRLQTVTVAGKQFEAGGSIIHERNAYMVNFTKLLGLETKTSPDHRVGLYNGKKMLFESSQWSAITLAKLFWRYSWNAIKLKTFIRGLLDKFDRIYGHQQQGLAFTTPERLLESMDGDLMAYLHYSLEEVLAHEGFSQRIIDELAMGAMKNNYGQTLDAQAFVGTVSLAGVAGKLWSVKGGNKQIVEGLIKKSHSNLIMSEVNQVTLLRMDEMIQFEIASADITRDYDVVVIAAPLHDNISDISFVNFPEPITGFKQHYHRTVATFVHGLPHFTNFGYGTQHEFPEMVMVTEEKSFFNSLGKQESIYGKKHQRKQELPVWKVFSQQPLTSEQTSALFMSYEDLRVIDWIAAYPHYSSSEVNLPSFRLAPHLYYVNAIELASSCMEMMAIAARNVAFLAYYDWTGQTELINPHMYGEFGRQEL